ncbi:YER077C [Kluyveromyces marxianus]|uniref:YER077C n=1 Tax=Kluyveromyces marxianus TaxID=4911 RepID=A0ABX6F139_KLUMA|nr:YER077C [Kluyveromyces marxianus]
MHCIKSCARVRPFSRSFHIGFVGLGSQLKLKLNILQQKEKLVKQTEKELKKRVEEKRLKGLSAGKYGYSKQKANDILKKKYHIQDAEKFAKIGPLSDADTSLLAITKDKRLMYTMLGITRPQLKDSVLVQKDVQKFCKRDQLQKALFLIKLAGPNGAAGMNALMEHYLTVEKDGKSAVDLYTWRKKWQIPPNEYTESILFQGLAKLPEPISVKLAERVVKIVVKMIEDERLNNINFNAALSALSNCNDTSYLFTCFDLRPKGIKKDAITYTQLLIGCSKIEDPVEAIQRADAVMNMADPRLIDSQMFFHYANVWHSRKDIRFARCVLPLIETFYSYNVKDTTYKYTVPEFVTLPTMENWRLQRKLKMSPYTAHLILENCLKTGEYEYGIAFFEQYCKDHSESLTSKNILAYMELIIKAYPLECGYKCREMYRTLEENGSMREPLHALLKTYKAFERQASKKINNSDPEKASNLVQSCVSFIKENESSVLRSEKGQNESYIKWKAWMFLWNVVSPCKETLPLVQKKAIMDEFIRTMLYDNAMLIRHKGITLSNMRFIYLEAVRFVKIIETSLTLSDEQLKKVQLEPEEQSASIEKKKFLFKRHVMRLRKRLLEIVENLENGKDSTGNEIEKAFKQYCSLILSTSVNGF